ncbi:MAG: hypothetical protein KatS3mg023_4006 [Armatimonadota bacterium]|nr:MAG: hypothetical protein KatS3mg023_4006 [Armatimonadota bacterium]
MSHEELMRLFTELESRVRRAARRAAIRSGVARWADDVEQDVLLTLWKRLCGYDPDRCKDMQTYLEVMVQYAIRDALKRYVRWDSREVQFPDGTEL